MPQLIFSCALLREQVWSLLAHSLMEATIPHAMCFGLTGSLPFLRIVPWEFQSWMQYAEHRGRTTSFNLLLTLSLLWPSTKLNFVPGRAHWVTFSCNVINIPLSLWQADLQNVPDWPPVSLYKHQGHIRTWAILYSFYFSIFLCSSMLHPASDWPCHQSLALSVCKLPAKPAAKVKTCLLLEISVPGSFVPWTLVQVSGKCKDLGEVSRETVSFRCGFISLILEDLAILDHWLLILVANE